MNPTYDFGGQVAPRPSTGTVGTPMVADTIASGGLSGADAVTGQPIGRLGRADQIAAAVLRLCSTGASLVVGVALPIDGGYTARLPRGTS